MGRAAVVEFAIVLWRVWKIYKCLFYRLKTAKHIHFRDASFDYAFNESYYYPQAILALWHDGSHILLFSSYHIGLCTAAHSILMITPIELQ